MAFPAATTHGLTGGQQSVLDRICVLAARLMDARAAAIVLPGPIVRASTDPAYGPALAAIYQPHSAAGEDPFRIHALAELRGWDGASIGALVVGDNESRALQHLEDLASLAANEIELEHRRMRSPEPAERRRTQEHLLEKTLELTKFSEDLRQIHRLSTTNYQQLDQLLADYLDTGRTIFGLQYAELTRRRGRYATIVAARDGDKPAPKGTAEMASLYCGAVAETQQTIAAAVIADHPQLANRGRNGSPPFHCYLGSPILVDGELWGVLSFADTRPRWGDFTSHEVEVIELMAKGVARFLLEQRMQENRQRAEALESDRSRILEAVAKNRPLDEVLELIAHMVERQAPDLSVRLSQQAVIEDGDVWSEAATMSIYAAGGEVLGVLRADWKVAAEPRIVDLELLQMATQLASIAIEQRRLTERLKRQAQHDVLTGLPNRTFFTELLTEAIDAGGPVAVAFVDLDRFKQINDHWGHIVGDHVLRETAVRLERCLGAGEYAGRLGGDEFVAMLPGVSGRQEAIERAEAILDALREPISIEGRTLVVTASVGIGLHSKGQTAEALLAGADHAMYQVKHSGRNNIRMSQPEAVKAHARNVQLEHSLRQALESGEFRLYFQPVLDMTRQTRLQLEEMEVLLGWDHPSMGRIGPAQFIPIAEECGMIAPIGAWVLRQACLQSAEWRRRGLPAVRIAVNVSPLQFSEAGFVEIVRSALQESGLPHGALELELTESAILADIESSLPKLQQLRALGVHLTLDDFGTGYSSLTYLRWMPVQCLKIDRTFVAEMMVSDNTRTLIQAMIALAHSMNLKVVAEGIETEEQFDALLGFHCDYAQGHLFGEPLPVEEMDRWLLRTLQTAAGTMGYDPEDDPHPALPPRDVSLRSRAASNDA